MTKSGPTSNFEKNELAKFIDVAYTVPKQELMRSGPAKIKEALLLHIATINPQLAQEIITSSTEENVLKIVGRVERIATAKAGNDEFYDHNALGGFLEASA